MRAVSHRRLAPWSRSGCARRSTTTTSARSRPSCCPTFRDAGRALGRDVHVALPRLPRPRARDRAREPRAGRGRGVLGVGGDPARARWCCRATTTTGSGPTRRSSRARGRPGVACAGGRASSRCRCDWRHQLGIWRRARAGAAADVLCTTNNYALFAEPTPTSACAATCARAHWVGRAARRHRAVPGERLSLMNRTLASQTSLGLAGATIRPAHAAAQAGALPAAVRRAAAGRACMGTAVRRPHARADGGAGASR